MSQVEIQLDQRLAEHVGLRTGRRIRDLRVEVRDNEVILSGTARSFYVKQLAQQGAREVAPRLAVRNAIAVVRGVKSRPVLHENR